MPDPPPPRPSLATLPPAFIDHNQSDPTWLAGLPDLVAQLAERWSLTLAAPFPGIAINYVAPAVGADGRPCVLKVSRHVGETANEIAALRLWAGDGAARLLAADPALGALLVERLEPGSLLVEVAEADDDAATLIAATLLRRLWRPPPAAHGLRPLASWCAAFDRNRARLERGEGGFPAALFQRADALRHDLLTTTDAPVVLHGDLHHFNVLRAQRAAWLAIDPKGLAGDPCFDICQFFRNPRPGLPRALNRRRLDLFRAELGLDRPRALAWCFVHAMLDACWSFEDGEPWREKIAYAEETLTW